MFIKTFSDNERFSLFSPRPDRPMPGGSGTASLVGQVVTPTDSVAVGAFLMVNPVTVLGDEAEGAGGAITVAGAAVPVYLIGPRPARQGDLLLCRFVEHRWVAEYGGPGQPGMTLPGCPCTNIPATLSMRVKNQPIDGFESLVFPATLQWMAKPAELKTYRTDDVGYYGTADLVSSNGFHKFRYWFGCSGGTYFVSGLMTPDSPLGYPGRFVIMTWLVGMAGNTCSPFSLTNGASNSVTFLQQGVSIVSGGSA